MIEIKHFQSKEVLLEVHANALKEADLSGANLSGADLSGENLTRTNLRSANLSGAFFPNANLTRADLTDANMRGAGLDGANLTRTNLTRADLSGAYLFDTNFTDCPTLCQAKGWETIVHHGASTLDARTLRSCVNHLPDVFLRGVGYNQEEIENLRAMYAGGGIKYYSCFIAYRHADYDFAKYLHDQLETAGVTCWLDKQDMQGGKYERPQISAAIKAHDKLLLVCSKGIVVRPRVVEEVIAALEAEREGAGQKLFPVRLDEYIFGEEVLTVADAKLKNGEWREDWVSCVRAMHIPDFEHWKDHDRFQEQFQHLLRDLKNKPDA